MARSKLARPWVLSFLAVLLLVPGATALNLNTSPYNEYRSNVKEALRNKDYALAAKYLDLIIETIDADPRATVQQKQYAKLPSMLDKARAYFLLYKLQSNNGEKKPEIVVETVEDEETGKAVEKKKGKNRLGEIFLEAVNSFEAVFAISPENIIANEHLARLYAMKADQKAESQPKKEEADAEKSAEEEATANSKERFEKASDFYTGDLALSAKHLFQAAKWGYNAVGAVFVYSEYEVFRTNPPFLKALLDAPESVSLRFDELELSDPFYNPLEESVGEGEGDETGPVVITPKDKGSVERLRRLVNQLGSELPQLRQELRREPLNPPRIEELSQSVEHSLADAYKEVEILKNEKQAIPEELELELQTLKEEFIEVLPNIRDIMVRRMTFKGQAILTEMSKALKREIENWKLALAKWDELLKHVEQMRGMGQEFVVKADELEREGRKLKEKAERLKYAASFPIQILGVAYDRLAEDGVIIVQGTSGSKGTIRVKIGDALVRSNGQPLVENGDEIRLTGIEMEPQTKVFFQYQDIKFSRRFSRTGMN